MSSISVKGWKALGLSIANFQASLSQAIGSFGIAAAQAVQSMAKIRLMPPTSSGRTFQSYKPPPRSSFLTFTAADAERTADLVRKILMEKGLLSPEEPRDSLWGDLKDDPDIDSSMLPPSV